MPGIAVVGTDTAGGAQLGGGNSWFKVEGQLAVVLGDPVAGHGPPPHSPTPHMVEASSWFKIDGIHVCRAGNLASCGHATTGRGWFNIP